MPFFFQDEPLQAERIRRLAREMNACLLFGSPAHELRNGRSTFLNSAFLLSPSGETIGRADKMHLVPLGEYIPLGNILTFINKLVVGIGDFSPGERAVTLDTGVRNSVFRSVMKSSFRNWPVNTSRPVPASWWQSPTTPGLVVHQPPISTWPSRPSAR